jgi:hypothetical protein
MFHGANLATLANIAEEGFDLSACRTSIFGAGVFVSNKR